MGLAFTPVVKQNWRPSNLNRITLKNKKKRSGRDQSVRLQRERGAARLRMIQEKALHLDGS
ncbi:hypothetical protein YC2023_100239 [Brassica napus]